MDSSLHKIDPQDAADYFHSVVSHALDGLLERVAGESDTEKYARVSSSLREISYLYKERLKDADSELRTDWSEPVNQCAYVYLYFMQHCYMMYVAMQPLLSQRFGHIRARLEYRKERHRQLRVCSIGGGPGSDIVGLSRFLEDSGLFPDSLEFTVLDRWKDWARAWCVIKRQVPSSVSVTYKECDLVTDACLSTGVLKRLREVDILTLEKSFSAVVAFMEEETCRKRLLTILCELKLGCIVLFIDNRRHDLVTAPFFNLFALPAGLRLVNQWEGLPKVPIRGYSRRVEEFKDTVDYNPMSSCLVTNLLFVKTRPGSIPGTGRAGFNYEVYRRSMDNYGGFYEDTPLLKKIWWEDPNSIIPEDSDTRLFDSELVDFDSYSFFGFTEYGQFEINFRDMRAEQKCSCWARATKTRRRKRRAKIEREQRMKVGRVRVTARTNKRRKDIQRDVQTETPREHREAILKRHSVHASKEMAEIRRKEIRRKAEEREL